MNERLATALRDRYRIERELGQGGMATVYLASDLKHERQVAIKVLREDLSASLGSGRFLREIKIAAQLQHPHILPLLDSGEADGFLFFVMPYIKGQSLRERLAREGELPVHEAVRLLAEVVDALVEAHEHGVVHRDIKPDNVMLSGRHALVTDFGVAKAISEATGRNAVTTLGVAVGTPTYMSPEQAAADPHVDHRSDIYSVGVMAYEMLSGRPPFTGNTPQQVLAAHVTEAPDPVSKRRPAIPAALEQVVMRCLAKRPADRYQTASELHAALEPLSTPSGGMTPTQTRPIGAVAPRRRRGWMLMSAGAVALAAIVIFVLTRPSRGAQLAVASTIRLTTEAGLYLDPALSPDGKFVAYATGTPRAMRIVVRQLNSDRAIPLSPDIVGPQRWPQWSPDGQRIAFAASTGIYVVPALGGTAQRLVTLGPPFAVAASPTWSPDGKRIAFSTGTQIKTIELATGREFLVVPGGTGPLFDLQWSPDGRWIAAAVGNWEFAFSPANLGNLAGGGIILAPSDSGGSVRTLADYTSFNLSPAWLPDSRHLLFVSSRDGGREVYQVAINADGSEAAPAVRMTTGLLAHSISLAADGVTMTYSSYTPSANIWMLALAATGVASVRDAKPLTNGTDVIEETVSAPDRTRLAFTSDRGGKIGLYVMPLGGGPATQVSSDENVGRPAWSRDSREIAYMYRGSVRIVPSTGGVPVTAVASGFGRPDWAPDGKALVLMIADSSTAALAIAQRTSTGWDSPKPIAGTRLAYYPTWSPNGGLIAYQTLLGTRRDTSAIAVISRDGGTPRILLRQGSPADTPTPERVFWSDDGRSLYFRSRDSLGVESVWSLPADGGTPRMLVRFDDPERPGSLRARFSIVDGTFYTRIMHHESTLGVAHLVKR